MKVLPITGVFKNNGKKIALTNTKGKQRNIYARNGNTQKPYRS